MRDLKSVLSSKESTKADVNRRSSNYHPSIWGDHFINVSSNEKYTNTEVEKRFETLKAEIEKLLVSNNTAWKTLEEIVAIVNQLQRLGVAYHFENEIKEALQTIYDSHVNGNCDVNYDHNNDLYIVALRFRLLRQHGYKVSADIFKKFRDEKGEFKAMLTNDAKGLLCLYEASYLRVQGENILEEACEFSRKHLKSLLSHLSTPLADQVEHSLEIPLHRGMPRLEARQYISIYEADNSTRNELILELAKLDFNLLQALHRIELSEISRWWKDIDFATKLPFARDRLVECYFWILGVYFEPKYSTTRKFMTKIIAIASVIDDIYDVYGTLEELKLFTHAIESIHIVFGRWEVVAANELPKYMQVCYFALLDVVKEMEDKLVNKEPLCCMYYAKEAIKGLVRAYFVEAKWFHAKYVPTFEECVENSTMSSGYPMLAVEALVGLEDMAITKRALDWAISVPKIIRSSSLIARLDDDVHTYKVEQERGDAPSSVECYVQQYGVSEEEACNKIKGMVEIEWMNINEEIQDPNHPPLQWLLPSLNLARMMVVLYQNGDGYTNSTGKTKDRIASLLVDPLPM
ncbi:alpha-humulene/(-)-(E)-beta-caryophyllene synthase [Citrus sinensis]|uniref:SQS6a n=1 Tax=Citrus sinensis TaxID=2711 RepID=A0A290U6M9_CITSI|nr:(-)-germacrene D synthase-like isoform X1 [Citrus x clementina]ATD14147.1 SQS6a [Citrus sinensis]KAH9651453.1 alpha-humulene/(-)-(E)-beta-caryophyllene synthase [Citrus sinensis]